MVKTGQYVHGQDWSVCTWSKLVSIHMVKTGKHVHVSAVSNIMVFSDTKLATIGGGLTIYYINLLVEGASRCSNAARNLGEFSSGLLPTMGSFFNKLSELAIYIKTLYSVILIICMKELNVVNKIAITL